MAFIQYIFRDNHLVQVEFGTHSGESFDAGDKLIESLQSVWGKPTGAWHDQFEGVNLVWKGEVVVAVLRVAKYGSDCQARLSDRRFFERLRAQTDADLEKHHKSTQRKAAGDL